MDTYNLKDIASTLGLKSTHAARKRVNALRELLERRELVVYIPEQGGALGVKPGGLRLLQRLQEIGKEGKNLAQATEWLLFELGEKKEPLHQQDLKLFRVEVRDKLKTLEERIEALEDKRPWWVRAFRALPKGKSEQKVDPS